MSSVNTPVKPRVNKAQVATGFALLAASGLLGIYLNGDGGKLPLFLISGLLLGYILTRSRFGFAGGIKRIYVLGDSSLTRAILIMLGVGSLMVLGIHWYGASKGLLPAFLAPEGEAFIPGSQSVYFANISTVLGGIIFGMGMILAGGCASGTLSDMGEGEFRSLLALITFVMFAPFGHLAKAYINDSSIGKIGAQVHFPTTFGYVGAAALTAALLLGLYILARKYEDFRKREGTWANPDWEDFEKPIPQGDNFKVRDYSFYHKLFVERWSFATGALGLAVMSVFIIVTSGKSWGVTSAFTTAAVWVFDKFGINFTHASFDKINKAAAGGLLNDPGTVRNLGIILGATIAFLLAGRFVFNRAFTMKDSWYFILGGAFMGFGARLANGCNIGALLSSIINFSLSGWVFLVSLCLGGVIALKLFAGRMCLVPPSRYAKTK